MRVSLIVPKPAPTLELPAVLAQMPYIQSLGDYFVRRR